PFGQLYPAEMRHFLIDNYHIVGIRIGIECRQGGVAVFRAGHVIARSGKDIAQGKDNRRLVVDRKTPHWLFHRPTKSSNACTGKLTRKHRNAEELTCEPHSALLTTNCVACS